MDDDVATCTSHNARRGDKWRPFLLVDRRRHSRHPPGLGPKCPVVATSRKFRAARLRRDSLDASAVESILRPALRVQAIYYLVTGLWPFVSIRTFEAISGPKRDDWLVKTVGALVSSIGAALLRA